MGLIGSSARMQAIIARRQDLEVQTDQLNNTRTLYATMAADQMETYSDEMANLTLNPSSSGTTGSQTTVNGTNMPAPNQADIDQKEEAITAQMNASQAQYGEVDKLFEQMLKVIDTEHKALDTEYDAVQKVIEKSIDRGFKTLG